MKKNKQLPIRAAPTSFPVTGSRRVVVVVVGGGGGGEGGWAGLDWVAGSGRGRAIFKLLLRNKNQR